MMRSCRDCSGYIPRRSISRSGASNACSTRSAGPTCACRRPFMSPAPTAKARPSPFCARCWRRRAQRVHVYTSPHLMRFNERIRLAAQGGGKLVDDARARRGARALRTRPMAAQPITFFEITTAAAFHAFRRDARRLAAARDRTRRPLRRDQRVARPKATIVTSVSLDHHGVPGRYGRKNRLREGRHFQARRPGDHRLPVGRGARVLEREARRVGAPLSSPGRDFHIREENGRLVFEDERGLLDLPLPRLPGRHQHRERRGRHRRVARGRAEICRRAPSRAGLTRAEWPARLQHLVARADRRSRTPERRDLARRRP